MNPKLLSKKPLLPGIVKAKTEWAAGAGRTLSLSLKDDQGNESIINLNYNIRNFRAEENAARAAIQAKRNASSGFDFPTSDEYTCALLMRCSKFENGWIDFDEISKVTRVFYY